MARPSKYDPYTESVIVKYIEDGYSQADAAQLSGISEATFYTWMKEYPEFSESIKKAVIKSKQVLIDRIKTHGLTDWKANAWMLERRFPQEFAIKQITEHTGKVEQAITVNVVPFIPHGASKDQLERIRSAYGDEAFSRGMKYHLSKMQDKPQVIEGQTEEDTTPIHEDTQYNRLDSNTQDKPPISDITAVKPSLSVDLDKPDTLNKINQPELNS